MILPAALSLYAFAGSVLLGDITADEAITAEDARLALRTAVGLTNPTETGIRVLDVDFDGEVTAADARLILRAAVGLEAFEQETVEIDGIEDYFYDDSVYDDLFSFLPSDFPEAPEVNADPDTFTFVVYGYGHGVGLTQYGAVAMGNVGFPYDYILSYYYSGTTLARDKDYPETTMYAGSEVNTEELVARITSMEIGGIATEENALKAQAVAVFTLLKKYNFKVENRSSVGIASSSYDNCSEMLKNAVKDVMGEYVVMLGDPSLTPVLTVYSASCAGSTVGAYDAWRGDNFPVSVASPFDSYYSSFITYVTRSSEEMKERILAWNPETSLSDNPADWLEIISHNASIDSERGYVTELRIGDKSLKGIGAIDKLVKLRSGCYTIIYTPGEN